MKFVPMPEIYHKLTLVQVMAGHRAGLKPLPEPVMSYLYYIIIVWCHKATMN